MPDRPAGVVTVTKRGCAAFAGKGPRLGASQNALRSFFATPRAELLPRLLSPHGHSLSGYLSDPLCIARFFVAASANAYIYD